MISYRGNLKRMDYEDVGTVANSLINNTMIYRKHLDDVSTTAYRMFKNCKSDFDNGYILIDAYKQLLRNFRTFFTTIPTPYQESLHSNEILKEVERHLANE